jgi:hypothetical protein
MSAIIVPLFDLMIFEPADPFTVLAPPCSIARMPAGGASPARTSRTQGVVGAGLRQIKRRFARGMYRQASRRFACK